MKDFDLDNYINWDKIAKDYSLESGDISLHDTCYYFFTGGTTSASKCVKISYGMV